MLFNLINITTGIYSNTTNNYTMTLTTIQITHTTRDKLKHIGRKEESYEQLILRLILEAGYEKKD